MPTTRRAAAAGVIGDKLYVVGGYDITYLNDLEVYDSATDSWTTLETPILGEWRLLGAAALDPYIYAMGGRSGRSLSANEAYQAQFRIILPVAP